MPKISEPNSATRAGDRMAYKVYVDDAFHYMDERARYEHDSFRTPTNRTAENYNGALTIRTVRAGVARMGYLC